MSKQYIRKLKSGITSEDPKVASCRCLNPLKTDKVWETSGKRHSELTWNVKIQEKWGIGLFFVTFLKLREEETQTVVSAQIVYKFVYKQVIELKAIPCLWSLKYHSKAMALLLNCLCFSFVLVREYKPGGNCPNLQLYFCLEKLCGCKLRHSSNSAGASNAFPQSESLVWFSLLSVTENFQWELNTCECEGFIPVSTKLSRE